MTNGVDDFNYSQEAWGTAQAVAFLEYAGARVASIYSRPAFRDLSLHHGGTFHDGQHSSHKYGLDIDIRPMGTLEFQCNNRLTWNGVNKDKYHLQATIELA